MLKAVFELNGVRIKEPINYRELSIELNFDKDSPDFRGEVATNSWTFGNGEYRDLEDGANIINKYIADGLIGGLGVFHGISFRIYLEDSGNYDLIYDGILDLSNSAVNCHQIQANSIETGKIDWFNEVADSFSFEYLYELGKSPVNANKPYIITKNDFVTVPYLLSGVPDTFKAVVISLSFYAVLQDLLLVVDNIREKISEIAGSGGMQFGSIFSLVIAIIRLTIIIVTIIELLKNIYEVLIGKVKYHEGMYLVDLCKKGAEYLGLEFKSSIIETHPYNKVVVLPEKYQQFNNFLGSVDWRKLSQTVLGIDLPSKSKDENLGYYKGTYGDLLRELKNMFNAKVVIKDNIIRLESVRYNPSNDLYQLPDIDTYDNQYTFNSDDLKSFYSISFQPDLDDKNIWQNFTGTELQVVTAPKFNGFEPRNVLTKGTEEVRINFARGIRKESLTYIEQMYSLFLKYLSSTLRPFEKVINKSIVVINKLIKFIKKIVKILNSLGIKLKVDKLEPLKKINLTSAFTDFTSKRLNILLMENDFVNIPKLVMIKETNDGNQVHADNFKYINAKYLWDNFHYVNSFVEDDEAHIKTHNQYKIYEKTNIPFCIEDYYKVRSSNFIYESNGITQGEIVSLKWNIYAQTADIKYKIRDKYTDNLKLIKVFSDGR